MLQAIKPWRSDVEEGGVITFHMRASGPWTRDLYAAARAACNEPELPPPPGGLHRRIGESVFDDETDGAAAGLSTPFLGAINAQEPLSSSALPSLPPVPESLAAISIDGPYGRMPPFGRHRTIVLFAGGIGITPLIAIATDIFARWSSSAQAVPPVTVLLHLVWTVRDAALLAVFADRLVPLLSHPSFVAHLHVTGRPVKDPVVAAEVRQS